MRAALAERFISPPSYSRISGTTAKAVGIHPVPFRTRKLSPPTSSAVVRCASPREAYLPSGGLGPAT